MSTSESILQLSKLLQYIIYDSEKLKISVVQELSSEKAFTELYQLKYNNQLDLTFEVSDTEILELHGYCV
ncbi:hypothetical protein [Chryseobacterium rhizoplanae]|uniref:hypothetical protein n=1 Tax=Chryseobacterium rhizoplanae TaxID=1609531 RepID=UPI0021D3F94F|nr:hypothetical protein [Chryseobacterium rhizoplanae]